MWYAEGLVKVEVGDVGTIVTRTTDANLQLKPQPTASPIESAYLHSDSEFKTWLIANGNETDTLDILYVSRKVCL